MPALVTVAGLILLLLVIWSLLAAVTHLLPWLIVGLISGALASRLVEGKGLGCLMDTVVGMGGGLLGGLVIHYLAPWLIGGPWPLSLVEDIIVSFLGAVVVLTVVRLVTPKRHRVGGRRVKLIGR